MKLLLLVFDVSITEEVVHVFCMFRVIDLRVYLGINRGKLSGKVILVNIICKIVSDMKSAKSHVRDKDIGSLH